MSNTIWKLMDLDGNSSTYFEDLASIGTNHFRTLSKEPNNATITEIIKLAMYSPNLSTLEENDKIMELVTTK